MRAQLDAEELGLAVSMYLLETWPVGHVSSVCQKAAIVFPKYFWKHIHVADWKPWTRNLEL